jgi:hypothetical protein
MYLSKASKIRGFLITPMMLGLFIWHSTWVPTSAATALNYFIPFLALLVVVHEIYYVIYMHRAFISLDATVVRAEDTMDNNLPIRNYDVSSEFRGVKFTQRFSESALGNDLAGREHCHILVQRNPPHAIFIDSFKLKYLNLIFSLMLVCLVYYYYSHQG